MPTLNYNSALAPGGIRMVVTMATGGYGVVVNVLNAHQHFLTIFNVPVSLSPSSQKFCFHMNITLGHYIVLPDPSEFHASGDLNRTWCFTAMSCIVRNKHAYTV